MSAVNKSMNGILGLEPKPASASPYAASRQVTSLDECYFYYSMPVIWDTFKYGDRIRPIYTVVAYR
jgi:hypothetical protein